MLWYGKERSSIGLERRSCEIAALRLLEVITSLQLDVQLLYRGGSAYQLLAESEKGNFD